MKLIRFDIPGLLIIEPQVFGDARGFFIETYNEQRYIEAGLDIRFVQDNLSFSRHGILRGLHFQEPYGQGKLVQVLHGEVYDVVVDIRVGSPTFGQWHAELLSSENKKQFYMSPGMAHGFAVTSKEALFSYKCTEFYHPETEKCLLWNDPYLNIPWPVEEPLLSDKDKAGLYLKDFSKSELPVYG